MKSSDVSFFFFNYCNFGKRLKLTSSELSTVEDINSSSLTSRLQKLLYDSIKHSDIFIYTLNSVADLSGSQFSYSSMKYQEQMELQNTSR